MLNTGFGFQAWNAKRQPAAPTVVGQQLAMQQEAEGDDGMLPSLTRPPRGPMQAEGAESAEEMEADGDSAFDPSQEHSASNTRAALEDAIRRAKDLDGRPALRKPPAPNQQWQLATLGLDPVSIHLFTQTGDAAGGVG